MKKRGGGGWRAREGIFISECGSLGFLRYRSGYDWYNEKGRSPTKQIHAARAMTWKAGGGLYHGP